MSATPSATSYDQVPYDSFPFAQTHPSRLATVATLFGLKPPQVDRCRVLELGCASGGNIVPLAELLPNSTFVGVDLSARQVAEGEQLIRAAGLTNVSLRHASIADVDDSYGPFDYVLCHGVFSWVPREIQEKVFEVCAKRLTPNGVAYVSYNTYPGWHMRGMIRDMMRYHAFRFEEPQQRIGQARALLDFLAGSAKQDGGAYSVLLRNELEFIKNQSDYYLYHEQLEDINDPVYFHTFVERATAHGLRYLGESRITTMVTGNFGADVQKTLAVLSTDQIQTEQYLDFVRNRMFRETLLVRAEQAPSWSIDPDRVYGLNVGSAARAAKAVDLTSDAPAQFQSRSGMSLSTTNPLFKAAMLALGEAFPTTLPFVEVLHQAVTKLGRPASGDDLAALATGLLNTYVGSDLIEFHAVPIGFARVPGEKPVALCHARARAAGGATKVANRRHELVNLTDLQVRLLPLLDGTRDRAALVEALADQAGAGRLTVQKGGQTVTDRAELCAALGSTVGTALEALARDALLVA